jgi:hypothetical protein
MLNLRSNTVRPPDENQHGSTRPNLLSGARRHAGGDDNILERLERDSARQASGNRSRAVWYAAAASLMLLMLIVLAWTAYDNASMVHVVPMTRAPSDHGGAAPATAAKPEPAPATGPALVQVPASPPASPPASAPASPPAAPAPVAPLPPLVLLPSHEAAAPSKPPAPAKVGALAQVAAPVPAKPAVRAAPTLQPTPAAARPAVRLATAARPRKPGASPLQTDAVVDTDVALISAIIIHDAAHAEEKAQLEATAACARAGAKKCPGRAGAAASHAN